MESLTRKIARQADKKISKMHRRLRRYLESEAIAYRKANKMTLGKAYGSGWENMRCVFMLSTGRTGTQTMARMLALSPRVVAEHEPNPRLVKSSFDAYMDACSDQWLARWTDFVLAVRDDFVLSANAEGKVYVESNNRLTYLADAVVNAFPASKYVFSHRDPYKVIRSGMRRGAYSGPNYSWNFARIKPRPGEANAAAWEEMSPLSKEAWRWSKINQLSMDFMEKLPAPRKYELPAAKLFSEDPEVYREIFDFVGVDCPPIDDIKKVMAKKINAQFHFGGFEFEWTDETYAEVRPYIASVAEALGYDVK